MRSKEKRRHHFALSLLFSFVVFCVIFVSALVAGVAVYILTRLGVISGGENAGSPLQTLIFMVVISNVVGLLVALLAGHVPLRPVKRIIDGMQQLASGNFKIRLEFGAPIRSHPTFTELTDSFNTMAQELENTQMLRSDFINNFSHEFKTPIVSIAGFAKLLKRGNLSEEKQAEYLDIIETESLRLSQMATNVLHLTKVENQMILTEPHAFNLSEQLRTCILMFIDKLEQKNLELQAEFGEHTIVADEELLKQVWINLISNAVKFSPEYGTIVFRVEDKGETVSVCVTNSGETIPREKQEKIFNKFYQCDESHAAEGNGIGLAVVKKVVELHRGTVQVHSENNLTEFTVELPKVQ